MNNVQVLMSTYNGEKYLREQINSILNQKDVNIYLFVRDDGSTDGTVDILKEYEKKGLIKCFFGKNIGYKKSFLHLLWLVRKSKMEYYSFADQDDIWLEDKISSAISLIGKMNTEKPVLYTSSLQRVDSNLKKIGIQKFKNLKLTVGNEIARHRLAGCTYVFNYILFDIVKNAYNYKELNCSHDELVSLLCMSCGGKVFFDNNSHILFRRHNNNSSIDGQGFLKKFLNEMQFFSKRKNEKYNYVKSVLKYFDKYITLESKLLLEEISTYKDSSRKTIKLIMNEEIDSGFKFYNVFLKFLIIIRFF